jgi:hypothetical protein
VLFAVNTIINVIPRIINLDSGVFIQANEGVNCVGAKFGIDIINAELAIATAIDRPTAEVADYSF